MITKHNIIAAYNICVTCDVCNTIMNPSQYDRHTNTYNSICPNCGHVENTGSQSYPHTQFDYEIKGIPIRNTTNYEDIYVGKWIAFKRRSSFDRNIYHGEIISIVKSSKENKDDLVFEVKNSRHGKQTKYVKYDEILGFYESRVFCYANDYKHRLGFDYKLL